MGNYKNYLKELLKDYNIPEKEIRRNNFFWIAFDIGMIGTLEESLTDHQKYMFTNTDAYGYDHIIYLENNIPIDVLCCIKKITQNDKIKWLATQFKIVEYDECIQNGSSGYGRLIFEKIKTSNFHQLQKPI